MDLEINRFALAWNSLTILRPLPNTGPPSIMKCQQLISSAIRFSLISVASALWPIPSEYAHGDKVLWIAPSVLNYTLLGVVRPPSNPRESKNESLIFAPTEHNLTVWLILEQVRTHSSLICDYQCCIWTHVSTSFPRQIRTLEISSAQLTVWAFVKVNAHLHS